MKISELDPGLFKHAEVAQIPLALAGREVDDLADALLADINEPRWLS